MLQAQGQQKLAYVRGTENGVGREIDGRAGKKLKTLNPEP
jgi:hypothetical protein